MTKHWQVLRDYLTTQTPNHFAIENTLIATTLLNLDHTKAIAQRMLDEHDHISPINSQKSQLTRC